MITKKKREYANDILANDLFPHCRTKQQKIYFLGYMTRVLVETRLRWRRVSDRDSYVNKRIDTTGTLLNNLFRNYFGKLVKEMQKNLVREINNGSSRSNEEYEKILNDINMYKIIKPTIIENGLNRALATGDFSVKAVTSSSKVGVAQVLNRMTYLASVSHLRRINTPMDACTSEMIQPRKLHSTSKSGICCVETPEGQSIGVVKNLGLLAKITTPPSRGASTSLLDTVREVLQSVFPDDDDGGGGGYYVLDDLVLERGGGGGGGGGGGNGVDEPADSDFDERIPTGPAAVKILVNGAWVAGTSRDAMTVFERLKSLKCSGRLNVYTSVLFDIAGLEIRLCSDGGRLTCPLLRIDRATNLTLLDREVMRRIKARELTWTDLLCAGLLKEAVVEYVDPEERNFLLISLGERRGTVTKATSTPTSTPPTSTSTPTSMPRYSHVEIHPSSMFGVLASCIPFPEHNQAPRNTYQCAMGKQAIGTYALNYSLRMDKTAYVMSYPTRPLVETRIMDVLQLNRVPSGAMQHVAIMSHTGYNQEDSVIMNKASIDRGAFMSAVYTTVKDEAKSLQNDDIIRTVPQPHVTKGIKFANYNKLQPNGFMRDNELVENRDVIIGKVVPIKENKNDPSKKVKFEDHSISYRTNEEAYVDGKFTGRNGDGYHFAKVRIRKMRKVDIGDKFSSRSGQKGTCGRIIPECDMPFTQHGLVPDIILNPHAIPSRMTIAQLKETLLGKVLLDLGLFGDGTAFGDLDIQDISGMLLRSGFESYGNEIMYNALTGEQMQCSVFIGPVYYQRLKHMVSDKQHSRSIGPMVNLTRQPAEGRCRDGGFRIGEMERDVMLAHGMSFFCRERLFEASDRFSTHVCRNCGMIAAYNDNRHLLPPHQQQEMIVHKCKLCDNSTDFALVEIPYAYKLMAQELQTINVVPRIICEE